MAIPSPSPAAPHRGAISAGAHYFDLCDNADFCEGISALKDDARAANLCVYSGMSSVPAISSAAVTALCDGATPLMIDSAILPGNKAPRGRSVVDSILHQTGRNYGEVQGVQDTTVRAWSDPKTYDLGRFKRQGWRIEVPDQRQFPKHFNCNTVSFRAPDWLVSLVMQGAKLLAPFGTGMGGMVVEVTLLKDNGPKSDGFIRKTWRMRARGMP